MAIGNKSGKLKVAVLMGGLSSEREISLSTGKQVLEMLDTSKYDVFGVDAAIMPGSRLSKDLGADGEVDLVIQAGEELMRGTKLYGMDVLIDNSNMRPDVVFVALHGKYGEDGCIQGLLDIIGLPYTGSGVMASALAMDKTMSKKIMSSVGVLVPRSFEISSGNNNIDENTIRCEAEKLTYPLIVKPSRQGSTIGMSRVHNEQQLIPAVRLALKYDTLALIEEFVQGMELTVSVLGNEDPVALPVIEIVPASGFYDYKAKYTPGATEEIVPARISEGTTAAVQELAKKAHRALRCQGVSRVDFIYDRVNLYALEVNTIPGMTPTSLLPTAASAAGIGFAELLDKMIELAMERYEVPI